jgi:putative Mn2+ efflux pump MntP
MVGLAHSLPTLDRLRRFPAQIADGRSGKRLGDKAEFASGIVLILLGIALLINQITGSHFP